MNTGPPWPQALLEVGLCSGLPTQFVIAAVLALFGLRAGPDGAITLALVACSAGLDTLLQVGLVLTLLARGGESPRQVLLGRRPVGGEVLRGLGLLPWVFVLVLVTALLLARFAPWVDGPNPLATVATTRLEFVVLAVVAMFAGGLREETQRAFILHRCEQRLGGSVGPVVGVLGFGVLFGLGHLVQGFSAAVITALLGMLWSLVYLARRSIVAPMVSHASFNLIEVIGFGLMLR